MAGLEGEYAAQVSVRGVSVITPDQITRPGIRHDATTGTIPSLNGIRAIAVTMVFFAHSGLEYIVPGGLGVTIFFVLSGYLITTLMRLEFAESGGIDYRGFYQRRIIRLMPPLLILVAVAGGLSAVSVIAGGFTPSGLMAVLFYYANYYFIAHDFHGVPSGLGPMWSLAVEEHFYILFPPLAALLMRVGRVRLSVAVLSALCALMMMWRTWLVLHGVSDVYISMATETRADPILFGCILAMLSNPRIDRVAPPRMIRDWSLLAGAMLLLLATLAYRNEFFRFTLRYSLQSLSIAVLLYLAVARADQRPYRWLNSKPMIYIGTISYSVYLVSCVIQFAVHKYWPRLGWSGEILASAALTLVVAESMRRWVEAPFAGWRKRLHRTRVDGKLVPRLQATPSVETAPLVPGNNQGETEQINISESRRPVYDEA